MKELFVDIPKGKLGTRDKRLLLALVVALEVSPTHVKWSRFRANIENLTRGDWMIVGPKAGIYVPTIDGDTWGIGSIQSNSERHWKAIQRKLKFMERHSEGIFRLNRLPTKDEAKVLRKILGLKKTPSKHPS